MNPWYSEFIELGIICLLALCVTVAIVRVIGALRRKKPVRDRILMLAVSALLLTCTLLYLSSHATYYRFNDRLILRSSIDEVIEKYGMYDIGSVTPGVSGRIGYYIYTDNGPIMPDHLDHYYWISFDESGAVTKVSESAQPGG